jgi:hypothetical protein
MFAIYSPPSQTAKLNRTTSSGWKNILTRLSIAAMLTVTGIMAGIIPEFSKTSGQLNFSTLAYAQDFRPEEVTNYAKAGFQMELLRRQVYRRIKKMMNESPQNISCDRPNSYENLSNDLGRIVNTYCKDSRDLVTNNNLSVSRFNELKKLYDRGGDFYQQVQNALIKLQQNNR